MHHLPLLNSGSETEDVLQENMIMYMNSNSNNQNNNDVENLLLMGSGNVIQTGLPRQGLLSLSLGNHVPSVMRVSPIGYHGECASYVSAALGGNGNALMDVPFDSEDRFRNEQTRGDGDYVISNGPEGNSDDSVYMCGMASIGRGVSDSKYLRAAQQLLDEVVNVKRAVKKRKESTKEGEGELGDEGNDPDSAVARSEHSVAEKQELQDKLSKLLLMSDEVDGRYRQYRDQMHIVASSFDVIAGAGAAKPYTALALQTISRHFRCLRDVIIGQIVEVRKRLGEESSCLNDNKGIGISRLRFVDQHLRQQRALQQLGMMQPQNVWRPQRGLPETSVLILRAWLFEHFLHPYPKDSEKLMLAKKTGLSRSQVSNWFINARVRLWKPMIEVIYKEETGEADMNSNSSSDTIPRPLITTGTRLSEEKADKDLQQSATSTKAAKPVETTMGSEESSSIVQNMMQCSTSERFGNVSGLSLTLGLEQREEGDWVEMSANSMSRFVHIRNGEVYSSTPEMGTETGEFECVGSDNQAHRFLSSLRPSFT